MAYIFARTERNLERYCKIKDNNLSFQVGVFSSWWVGDFSIFWVDVLVFFELISWCFFEFLSWWVDKLTGWQVDLSCTSCVRRVFILCWHHRENKYLLIYRNIKSQYHFYNYPNKLTKPTLTNLSTRLPVNKLTTLHCKYFYRTSPNSLQPFAFSLRWKGNRAYSTSFPDAIFVSSRVRAYHI